jgi:uncharacterized protein
MNLFQSGHASEARMSWAASMNRRLKPAYLGIGLVYAYRYTFGALFPASCKYYPSCSQYALDALRHHGLMRGSVLAGWRILRCNPWSHGGVDYAGDQRLFRR